MLLLSKNYLFFGLFFLLSTTLLFSEEGFVLKGRSGILVKIDPASGFQQNHPKKKGPTLEEIPKKLSKDEFEKKEAEVKKYFKGKFSLSTYYELKNEEYLLKDLSKADLIKLRNLLMAINYDNEIPTGLDIYGTPMPHNFPRVFDPKTKANFDIHFVWGYRFSNDISLLFSANFTNFIMPSLEITVQYNFPILKDYNFEPYIAGIIYGGFLDGFPIGFNIAGGLEFFPEYIKFNKTNVITDIELRLGAVLYTKTYFDTGINSEGIWKKLGWLIEGGIYGNAGYRFDNKN